MTFTRTDSGLSNSAVFYGVDAVVYTEGGNNSFSVMDVLAGRYSKESVDIRYWSKVFKKYAFGKRIEFRSLGSRATLDEICRRIEDGRIKNSAVVKDRDLDPYCGVSFSSPLIVQTYGYSWENDVWKPELIISLLDSLHFSGSFPAALKSEIISSFGAFERKVSRLVLLEIGLRRFGDSIIPKCNGEQLVDRKRMPPSFNQARALQLIAGKKALRITPYVFGIPRGAFSPIRDCYGKLVQAFGYRIVEWSIKREKISDSAPISMVHALIVNHFEGFDMNAVDPLQNSHYVDSLSRLEAAI